MGLGAQNLFWEEKGPFTGEIAASMLTDLGCEYVIIGHSERRQWFGETDEAVNKKIKAAIRHRLRPIVCLGDSLGQRESGQTEGVITAQLQQGLRDISAEDGRELVL